jgi:hypothetical protein
MILSFGVYIFQRVYDSIKNKINTTYGYVYRYCYWLQLCAFIDLRHRRPRSRSMISSAIMVPTPSGERIPLETALDALVDAAVPCSMPDNLGRGICHVLVHDCNITWHWLKS